jgi:hypothetical protein
VRWSRVKGAEQRVNKYFDNNWIERLQTSNLHFNLTSFLSARGDHHAGGSGKGSASMCLSATKIQVLSKKRGNTGTSIIPVLPLA